MNVNQIQAMKKAGEKSVALVVWDAPTAHIAHQCGADFLIVGDSVGVNLWGQSNNLEITLDDFLVAVKAVGRGAPGRAYLRRYSLRTRSDRSKRRSACGDPIGPRGWS